MGTPPEQPDETDEAAQTLQRPRIRVELPAPPGERLAGDPPPLPEPFEVALRLRTVGLLHRGRTATVYLADQSPPTRRLALKVLHPEPSRDRPTVARYLDEARRIARLGHPNIVDILACGEDPSGAVYVLMEMLAGDSLAAALRSRQRPFPATEVCRWALKIAQALAALHRAGIVHGDLSPAHIHRFQRGASDNVKLLAPGSTGLSMAPEQTRHISPGAVHYLAPERIGHEDFDARADIYSFGCTLFELLTGRSPFVGNAIGVLLDHRQRLPPTLEQAAPGITFSPALQRIVARAMARAVTDRYASMREVEHALLDLLPHEAPEPMWDPGDFEPVLVGEPPPTGRLTGIPVHRHTSAPPVERTLILVGEPTDRPEDTARLPIVDPQGEEPPARPQTRPVLDRVQRWLGRFGARAMPGTLRIGASAPRRVQRGEAFTVVFVAYPPEQQRLARLQLQLQLPDRTMRASFDAAGRWPLGTEVEVTLSGQYLVPSNRSITFIWAGKVQPLRFAVRLRTNLPGRLLRCDATLQVTVAGLVVSRLTLPIRVQGTSLLVRGLEWLLGRLRPPLRSVQGSVCRSAFASFARGDLASVLQRIDAIEQFTGIQFWVDCFSLDPRDTRKPRLRREIEARDTFVLFWSRAASQSPDTEWEWRTALDSKGIEQMQAQILALDGDAALPDELAALPSRVPQARGAVNLALKTHARLTPRADAAALPGRSRRTAVCDLLCAVFNEAELREFMDLPHAPDLVHRLPGTGTTLRQLAWEAGGLLERDGLLPEALDHLADVRPNSRPEIWTIMDRPWARDAE